MKKEMKKKIIKNLKDLSGQISAIINPFFFIFKPITACFSKLQKLILVAVFAHFSLVVGVGGTLLYFFMLSVVKWLVRLFAPELAVIFCAYFDVLFFAPFVVLALVCLYWAFGFFFYPHKVPELLREKLSFGSWVNKRHSHAFGFWMICFINAVTVLLLFLMCLGFLLGLLYVLKYFQFGYASYWFNFFYQYGSVPTFIQVFVGGSLTQFFCFHCKETYEQIWSTFTVKMKAKLETKVVSLTKPYRPGPVEICLLGKNELVPSKKEEKTEENVLDNPDDDLHLDFEITGAEIDKITQQNNTSLVSLTNLLEGFKSTDSEYQKIKTRQAGLALARERPEWLTSLEKKTLSSDEQLVNAEFFSLLKKRKDFLFDVKTQTENLACNPFFKNFSVDVNSILVVEKTTAKLEVVMGQIACLDNSHNIFSKFLLTKTTNKPCLEVDECSTLMDCSSLVLNQIKHLEGVRKSLLSELQLLESPKIIENEKEEALVHHDNLDLEAQSLLAFKKISKAFDDITSKNSTVLQNLTTNFEKFLGTTETYRAFCQVKQDTAAYKKYALRRTLKERKKAKEMETDYAELFPLFISQRKNLILEIKTQMETLTMTELNLQAFFASFPLHFTSKMQVDQLKVNYNLLDKQTACLTKHLSDIRNFLNQNTDSEVSEQCVLSACYDIGASKKQELEAVKEALLSEITKLETPVESSVKESDNVDPEVSVVESQPVEPTVEPHIVDINPQVVHAAKTSETFWAQFCSSVKKIFFSFFRSSKATSEVSTNTSVATTTQAHGVISANLNQKSPSGFSGLQSLWHWVQEVWQKFW